MSFDNRMKHITIVYMFLLCLTTACHRSTGITSTLPKYGFFAENDHGLICRAADESVKEIILGRVCDLTLPTTNRPLDFVSTVSVVDVFKGNLKKGDSVKVVTFAEGGPSVSNAVGTLYYYFLLEDAEKRGGTGATFICEWTDLLFYGKYGDDLAVLLRKNLNQKANKVMHPFEYKL